MPAEGDNILVGLERFESAGAAADGVAAGIKAAGPAGAGVTAVFAPEVHYWGECLVCH